MAALAILAWVAVVIAAIEGMWSERRRARRLAESLAEIDRRWAA